MLSRMRAYYSTSPAVDVGSSLSQSRDCGDDGELRSPIPVMIDAKRYFVRMLGEASGLGLVAFAFFGILLVGLAFGGFCFGRRCAFGFFFRIHGSADVVLNIRSGSLEFLDGLSQRVEKLGQAFGSEKKQDDQENQKNFRTVDVLDKCKW